MGIFSRRPRDERPLTSVTAASQQVAPSSEVVGEAHVKKVEGWQSRAWEMYDEIGEVRFAARYMGDAQARLDLFVGIRPAPQDDPIPLDPEGSTELGYSRADAEAAADALERLKSPLGGRREIQRALGVHLFVPGECYLVGEPNPSAYPSLDERWDIYSVDEIDIAKDTRRVTLKAPGSSGGATRGGRELPADTAVYRIWRPHPRFSSWADSPIRSSLAILEELAVLTRAIHAAATSRLKGPGVLFLPNSMRNGVGGIQNAGQSTTDDPLVKDFITAAGTAMKDPGSAYSHVPLVVWMNDEQWSEMGSDKLLRWDQGVDEMMAQLRVELLQRFATAIDLPPEVLTGKASLNHWSAWLISDEAFRNHIEPLAMLLVDALTVNYLHSALAHAGVAEPERFDVWYDPSTLVSDPDNGSRAMDAFREGLISDVSARRALGYSEDDAPTEEPPEEPDVAPVGDDSDQDDEDESDGEQPPDESEPDREGASTSAPAVAAGAAEVDPRGSRLATRMNLADVTLLRDAHQYADQIMHRALERANARLRSLAMRDRAAKTLVECVVAGEMREADVLGGPMIRRLLNAETTDTDDDVAELLTLPVLARAGDWFDARLEAEAGAFVDQVALSAGAAEQARAALDESRTAGRLVLMAGLVAIAGKLLQRSAPLEANGESDGSLVAPSIVRDALRAAGGGGEKSASFYTGDLIEQVLREGGYVTSAWRWVYGPEAWRRRPFQPHRALDGMEFADPDDDRLGNSSLGWPGVSLYWPGDHPGCVCHVERTALEPVRSPTLLVNA